MRNNLCFHENNFRIMLVGDPHEKCFADTKETKNKIKDYLIFQYEAIKTLKPDLVVLMGDNASADTPEKLKEILLRITAPYYENNVPFSFILGNHDLETKVSDLNTQYNIYRSLPGILFPDQYTENGDYLLQVYTSDRDCPVLNLWHFYNGMHPDKKYHSHYSALSKQQIDWYEKTTRNSSSTDSLLPGIVFQHVPVFEEFELLNKRTAVSMLFDGVTGQDGHYNNYYTLKKTTSGYMGESPCTADYNTDQFLSWKKNGDIFAAFFGHDHMNDLCGKVDDILLAQCKTSSFRVYGDGMMQGVRIIDLNENAIRDPVTRMVYYRNIVGNDCHSLSGTEKILRDRTSVKLETISKTAIRTAPFILPFAALKLLKRRN